MKQRPSNKQPLLHTIRIIPNVVFCPIKEADLIQCLVYPLDTRTEESRGKSQILSSGHAFVEILILGNNSDERFEALLLRVHVTTGNACAACGRSQLRG